MPAIAVQTRAQSNVENDHDTSAPSAGMIMQAAALKAQFPAATHRPTAVCSTYNCHGLTFASRRTQIWKTSEVRKILAEDGYVRVANSPDVIAGDIVLYISEIGDIEHSGVITQNENLGIGQIIKVLSKWGSAHEVIHNQHDCPYSNFRIEYYRVAS